MSPTGLSENRFVNFENALCSKQKVIDKSDAKKERQLKLYKDRIRRFRSNMDRVSMAKVLLARLNQPIIATMADLEEKKQNATKKLIKIIKDEAVMNKFGALTAEELVE